MIVRRIEIVLQEDGRLGLSIEGINSLEALGLMELAKDSIMNGKLEKEDLEEVVKEEVVEN